MAGSSDNIELQEHDYYTSLTESQESSESKENIYTTPSNTSCNTQKYVSYKTPPFPDTGAAGADTGAAVTDKLKNKVRKYCNKQATKKWLGGIIGATFVVLSIASITANIVLIIALYNKIPYAHCDEMRCPSTTNELLGNSTLSDSVHTTNTDMQDILLSVLQNNISNAIEQSQITTLDSLTNITDTLSTDIKMSNSETVSKILTRMEELLVKNELLSKLICPASCKDIQDNHPTSPSGYYSISGRLVYCEMGELCGSEGEWTRLAYINMSDPNEECPSTFQMIQSNQVKACGRPIGYNRGCTSVRFPSHGISYSEVCGRVVGYQYGSTDAVDGTQEIDLYYVDGISITHGYSPRKHVWTLYAGLSEVSNSSYNCPCSTSQSTPSFVGNDYFCESGNPSNVSENKLYTDDPLWDGEGCGTNEGSCCSAPGLPWFHKTLNTTTNDYLELRSCSDFSTDDENTFFSICELYVK